MGNWPQSTDSSHIRVKLKVPDGIDLIWHLRTELGAGPMALFKLRDFELPTQVFVVAGKRVQPKLRREDAGNNGSKQKTPAGQNE